MYHVLMNGSGFRGRWFVRRRGLEWQWWP